MGRPRHESFGSATRGAFACRRPFWIRRNYRKKSSFTHSRGGSSCEGRGAHELAGPKRRGRCASGPTTDSSTSPPRPASIRKSGVVARRFVARGEVHLVRLDPTLSSEIRKTRPSLIVSPDELNQHLRTAIVAPMTTGGKPILGGFPADFRTNRVSLRSINSARSTRSVLSNDLADSRPKPSSRCFRDCRKRKLNIRLQ